LERSRQRQRKYRAVSDAWVVLVFGLQIDFDGVRVCRGRGCGGAEQQGQQWEYDLHSGDLGRHHGIAKRKFGEGSSCGARRSGGLPGLRTPRPFSTYFKNLPPINTSLPMRKTYGRAKRQPTTTPTSENIPNLFDGPAVPANSLLSSITSLSSSDDEEDNKDLDLSFLDELQQPKERQQQAQQHHHHHQQQQQQHGTAPVPGSPQLRAVSSSNAPSPGSSASSQVAVTSVETTKDNIQLSATFDSDSDDDDDAMVPSLLEDTGAATNASEDQTQRSPIRSAESSLVSKGVASSAVLDKDETNGTEDADGTPVNNGTADNTNTLSGSDGDDDDDGDDDNAYESRLSSKSLARKKKRQAVEDEEWTPPGFSSSNSTGGSRRSGTTKRPKSAAEDYKKMPYGGMVGQDTFLKLIQHARVAQTFSPVVEKDIIAQRHQLPSFCFLSIYESSEHTGQLVRRYPYCDHTGLISKKLVERIRKDLRKFKKENDMVKRQDYPVMQTPFGGAAGLSTSSSASSIVDTTIVTDNMAALLVSRANMLFDVVWDSTVPAIVVKKGSIKLSPDMASAAASALDRAWSTYEKECTKKLKKEEDAKEKERANKETNDEDEDIEQTAEQVAEQAAKEATLKAAKTAKEAQCHEPLPPVLVAGQHSSSSFDVLSGSDGLSAQSSIAASQALRSLLSVPSDSLKTDGFEKESTISKSSLLEKMMSRRQAQVGKSSLDQSTAFKQAVDEATAQTRESMASLLKEDGDEEMEYGLQEEQHEPEKKQEIDPSAATNNANNASTTFMELSDDESDSDASDEDLEDGDDLELVAESPIKTATKLRTKSQDSRVLAALDACVVKSKRDQSTSKKKNKALPKEHRRSVMSRLKQGLNTTKMKHHAQRNGFNDMSQLRRAEQREATAKAKEQAEREERERLEQNFVFNQRKKHHHQQQQQQQRQQQQRQQQKVSFASVAVEEGEESSANNFISSVTFDGVKAGMVFQAGSQGVGYYRDTKTTFKSSTNINNNDDTLKESATSAATAPAATAPAVTAPTATAPTITAPAATAPAATGPVRTTHKKTVTKTRTVQITREDDFGFEITEDQEETYEVEVEEEVEVDVETSDPSLKPVSSSVANNATAAAPTTSTSTTATTTATTTAATTTAATTAPQAENKESEDEEESEDEDEDEDEDQQPREKVDKNANFRAMLEAERREIRSRNKARRKVDGIFDEEASEEEDDEAEGLGNFGDSNKKRKRDEEREERRIDDMEDEIRPEDLEGVVDAPSDDEGDDSVDMDVVHAKMLQDQDKREQEELVRNVQQGWANAGKRGKGRRRGDVGYMMEGANNRHRKRLRLDEEEDENDEDLEGLDEEDMLAKRAERDAIRRGSDDDDDDFYSDLDSDDELHENDKAKEVDADEAAEIAEQNAVRRRAKRSQALRKQTKISARDIRNGGRGENLTRQTSVVEDDQESQQILSLVRRGISSQKSQHGFNQNGSDANNNYNANLLSGDSKSRFASLTTANGGGSNMESAVSTELYICFCFGRDIFLKILTFLLTFVFFLS
jgi:hypothetical protein